MLQMRRSWNIARRVDVGQHVWISGCPRRRTSLFYYLLFIILFSYWHAMRSHSTHTTRCPSVRPSHWWQNIPVYTSEHDSSTRLV